MCKISLLRAWPYKNQLNFTKICIFFCKKYVFLLISISDTQKTWELRTVLLVHATTHWKQRNFTNNYLIFCKESVFSRLMSPTHYCRPTKKTKTTRFGKWRMDAFQKHTFPHKFCEKKKFYSQNTWKIDYFLKKAAFSSLENAPGTVLCYPKANISANERFKACFISKRSDLYNSLQKISKNSLLP